MAEPEDVAMAVAMIRAALDEAASSPDRSIGGSQYAVLGHYTLPKVLDALEHAAARAERLAAENADWERRYTDLLDDVTGKNLELDRLRAALREIEGRVSEKEDNRWTWFSQYDSELRDIARAALAGDAPRRGEEG